MQVIIFSVLATLAGVAAVTWGVIVWRAWKQQTASRGALQTAIEKFTAEAMVIREAAVNGDKMMAGLIAVSKEQVGQMLELKTVVQAFSKAILKDVTGDGFKEYDAGAADQEYAIQQYMQNGMSREEAQQRFDQGDIYKRWKVMP